MIIKGNETSLLVQTKQASILPQVHHGTLKLRTPIMGSPTHLRSAGAMPASQEAIQRVILPALKRSFGAYVQNRAVIQKLISGEQKRLMSFGSS
jgi:hypothetical protein